MTIEPNGLAFVVPPQHTTVSVAEYDRLKEIVQELEIRLVELEMEIKEMRKNEYSKSGKSVGRKGVDIQKRK